MGRPLRAAVGGLVYHVLNRANAQPTLFATPDEYAAFVALLGEAQAEQSMPLLSYCVMPNHWHLVLLPERDGDLLRFRGLVDADAHTAPAARLRTTGSGHAYQGRFKSFPVEADEHFLTVCRYVERNALRAGLAVHGGWPWGSLWQRCHDIAEGRPSLSPWPVPYPSDWLNLVNTPLTIAEEEAVRRCSRRGRPFGSTAWTEQTVRKLELNSLHPPGRPRNNRIDYHPSLFDNGS